jgi:hypothetical protein
MHQASGLEIAAGDRGAEVIGEVVQEGRAGTVDAVRRIVGGGG